MVCWRTNAHSRSSSGPGLCRISSGTGELPEVVELGRTLQLFELVAPQAEHGADIDRERADVRELRLEIRLADGQRLEERRHRAVALAAA